MSTTEAAAERVRRRYPPRRLNAAVLIMLGFAVVAMICYVVWVASYRANPPVSGRLDTFNVTSDNEVTGTFTVDRPDPSVSARCFLVAQAVSFERVGERWVEVPPGSERLVQVPVTLRTFKRATALSVDSCSAG